MKKKPYIKPEVCKVIVDEDFIRMISHQGFVELFWERYQQALKVNPAVTREQVFYCLNEHWFKYVNYYRYSDYDSFRRRLNQ